MTISFKQRINTGGCLNATAVKIIAVLFMTLDHIGGRLFDVPGIAGRSELFRMLGRIAAPLFLYLVAESALHTKRRARYLLRMFIAAEIVGILNLIFAKLLNTEFDSNILHTFVWVIFLSYAIENAIYNLKIKHYGWASVNIALAAAAVILSRAVELLIISYDIKIYQVLHNVIRSPITADYSGLFISLGVAWYFLKTKSRRCILFFIICLIPIFSPFSIPQSMFFTLIQSTQWTMILALPVMLLYNGKKGGGYKYFFYIYYPLHIYFLAFLHTLFIP